VDDGRVALDRLGVPDGFDLVLLDVMLPGLDGLAVAGGMRRAGNYTPVLMLTAKGRPDDVVRGLEAGADDYLPKPFDLPVLLARVKGLLRRREWAREPPGRAAVRLGEAEVDFANFEVVVRGERHRLTTLEATLLRHLVQNAGRVVGKGEILEKVWNLDPQTETRAVDNFIVRLRRYLEPDPRSPRHLHTVRGAGYRLSLLPEE
jgi:DNA-binding response OmpR family regulator